MQPGVLSDERPRAAHERTTGERSLERTSRTPWVPLALLYLLTIAALVGYAVFGLHPELLARYPGAAAVYERAYTFAPRAQILLAFIVLAHFLVRKTGVRWVAAFAALYVISLASELLGTTVGMPFGPYRYTDGLGPKWFGHVPLLIPLSWFFMALPSYAIARRRFPSSGHVWRRVFLASFVLLSWDLALDPAMSFATTYWVWGTDGTYYGMPLLNLAGWYVTGLALMTAFMALRADAWLRTLPVGWLVAFYGANLLLPLGMCVAAQLWGAVAASGGALGLCVLLAGAAPRDPVAV